METLTGLSKYWEMFLLTSLLPLASFAVVFLRRDFVKGKVKAFFLVLGFVLLSYAIYSDINKHADDIGILEVSVASISAIVTYFLHSCLDGAVIGMAYFVNPLIGYGTFLAILSHEAPKIIGTIVLIRSLTKSTLEAIKYSVICQAGVPLVAILVFTFGKNIDGEWTHAVEFAGMAAIVVILLRISYHSYSHRGHAHD